MICGYFPSAKSALMWAEVWLDGPNMLTLFGWMGHSWLHWRAPPPARGTRSGAQAGSASPQQHDNTHCGSEILSRNLKIFPHESLGAEKLCETSDLSASRGNIFEVMDKTIFYGVLGCLLNSKFEHWYSRVRNCLQVHHPPVGISRCTTVFCSQVNLSSKLWTLFFQWNKHLQVAETPLKVLRSTLLQRNFGDNSEHFFTFICAAACFQGRGVLREPSAWSWGSLLHISFQQQPSSLVGSCQC